MLLLAIAPAASASPKQESIFEDDDQLVHNSPEGVDAAMAELKALGVDRVRLPALWRDLADPTTPGLYPPERLASLDRSIASAQAHGLGVLLNVRGGAPDWALPAKRPQQRRENAAWKPSPKAFGAFVTMLGQHYPQVDTWSLWNEPNWHALLQPQTLHGKPYAPKLYRRLFRAGSAALRATGHAANGILLGETAPLGTKSRGRFKPLYAARFYRSLFCLTRKLRPQRGCRFGKPLAATGIAHHPYPVVAPPGRGSSERDALRLADYRRLVRILDAARRYHRVGGRLPIFYTEFGYQTKPPDPYRGISLKRQASYLARAERIAYRQKRVLAFNQFLLRDSGPQTQYPASDRRYWSTYQTGLRFADGGEKPALAAYRLPLVRTGRRRLWGMVRPGDNGVAQRIRLERYRGGAWRGVRDVRVRNPRGYFTARVGAGRVPLHLERPGVPVGRERVGSAAMDFSQLKTGEIAAAIGGVVLVLAVFLLPAYTPSDNPNATVAGGTSDVSIWDANKISRILLVLAALAPIILLYIVIRQHELSWPRGELTAVIGLIAVTLLFWNGVIQRPGEPSGQIGLGLGWYLAFLGALAIAVGGAIRAAQSERRRKPPGVL